MTVYREVAPGIDEWSSEKGQLRIWSPGRGMVATRVRGFVDRRLIVHFMEPITRILTTGHRFTAFHDWEGITGYESDVRLRIAAWGARFVRQIDKITVLVAAESSLLRMAISVTNVAMGGTVEMVYDRARFEAEYERVTKQIWTAGPGPVSLRPRAP
ncbi:MAG: hypothetical protein HUU21_35760 [Polyangiaceae bacterium]|nr:hypothetical protein [Polyangiaceae bacterium]